MTDRDTTVAALPARDSDAESRAGRAPAGWRWLALLWLLVVVGIAVHQWQFWHDSRIDSDVLALLPRDADDVEAADATRRIAEASARQIVVLLGADDPTQAQAAADAFRQQLALADTTAPLRESRALANWFDSAQTFYAPYRDRLLTPAQRQRLNETPSSALAEEALAALYGPFGAPKLTDWRSDPLGLWPQWWQQRAAGAGLRMGDDGLLQADDRYWAVLQFDTTGGAFQLDGSQPIDDLLDRATAAARKQVPTLRELRAGVPLHAEAAAAQANNEVNIIGLGSLAAVLLLVWLAFRSLRPIALVALSLLIGVAAALSVTAMVFGKVHLLTLVFGASLVGVAEDYGIHWFASRQGLPASQRWSLLRTLLPGLWLALLTSVLAYAALGLAPFPGLRQMALFAATGLAGAFLTVICWFPWLDGGELRVTRFSRAVGNSLQHWPRLTRSRMTMVVAVLLAIFVAAGALRLRSDDDLRSLQSSPQTLIDQQIAVSKLLGLASPAQFYLVRGANAEQVLQREEALVARLAPLVEQRKIGGYRALSEWLPSARTQHRDAELSRRVESEVLTQVGAALGEPLQRSAFSAEPVALEAWLKSDASRPFRPLWLGELGTGVASAVLVDARPDALVTLSAQANGLPGVRWADRTGEFSQLLRHYRRLMSGALIAAVLLVFAVLWWRYRAAAWRVLLPSVLAGVLTLALLGWIGQPLQLFHVLALLLLLAFGTDYSIFLHEHQGDPSAWMAVAVGALSTWLSFGLLALSATPALHAFGLTLLFGIGLVVLLSPLTRPSGAAAHG